MQKTKQNTIRAPAEHNAAADQKLQSSESRIKLRSYRQEKSIRLVYSALFILIQKEGNKL